MRINELKASELTSLWSCENAEEIQAHHSLAHFSVDVEHRGLLYEVGNHSGWQGPYWLREGATGIIFRGSLSHLKDMIKLCSAAHHEPDAIR
ncbi:hypothetical protein AU161_gp02 [Pseudomonas phage PPPL-1]|uniref:Uncharacterized protein n=1 Tax=Pseudomonas phage PPPL-1 TaxID=1755692 RepID=A0A0S2MVK6_9CAUD|nr:hypothetical protein AU161_gp02 [Pseudomonas phage PPPL-1]ALO79962.1 hypothetical protein PPPL1_002 [Pseudomonas phage PPPL-1]